MKYVIGWMGFTDVRYPVNFLVGCFVYLYFVIRRIFPFSGVSSRLLLLSPDTFSLDIRAWLAWTLLVTSMMHFIFSPFRHVLRVGGV